MDANATLTTQLFLDRMSPTLREDVSERCNFKGNMLLRSPLTNVGPKEGITICFASQTDFVLV